MNQLGPFAGQQRMSQAFRPRTCVICELPIECVTGWKQTAHAGNCKAEQQRRYLAQVAEQNKKKRNGAKQTAKTEVG